MGGGASRGRSPVRPGSIPLSRSLSPFAIDYQLSVPSSIPKSRSVTPPRSPSLSATKPPETQGNKDDVDMTCSTKSTLGHLDTADSIIADLKHENVMLQARNKQLEDELRLLRAQHKTGANGQVPRDLLEGPLKTFHITDESSSSAKVWKLAEAEIAKYFSHKTEDPRKAAISVMQEASFYFLQSSKLLAVPAITWVFYICGVLQCCVPNFRQAITSTRLHDSYII